MKLANSKLPPSGLETPTRRLLLLGVAVVLIASFTAIISSLLQRGRTIRSTAQELSRTEAPASRDGSVRMPPINVPFSSFASPEAQAAFVQNLSYMRMWASVLWETRSITEQRRMEAAHFGPALERARALYPVTSVSSTIGGVHADVITPKDGIAPRNEKRVLISLHGGGFLFGAGVDSVLESVPVASLGKIEVVSVDYRLAPEYKYPAASEDVVAVYRELLKSYKPENIGIYGCSAGGVLTAEAVAWFQKENLPRPGAIGIFCASAGGWSGGDSASLAYPMNGYDVPASSANSVHPSVTDAPYFSNADLNDPLVEPIHSEQTLARFPPTLIVTSTRDIALSPAVYTHTKLVQLGVDAELHVWEGLGHSFFTIYPDLPESKDVWRVVTEFFDRHLGVG